FNPKTETAGDANRFKKKESWNLFAGCRENLFFLHLTKTIDQNEQREPAIPYFCFLKNGREATKIHEKLVNAVGEQALTLSTVRRWIAKFKGERNRHSRQPRSGRPREAVPE